MKKYTFYREDAPGVTIEREALIPGPEVKHVAVDFATTPPVDDEFVVVAEYVDDEGNKQKVRYDVEVAWIPDIFVRKAAEPKTSPKPVDEGCTHSGLGEPAYDKVAAEGLSAEEVRKRWPRLHGRCPDCNTFVIKYASFEHYIAGDW